MYPNNFLYGWHCFVGVQPFKQCFYIARWVYGKKHLAFFAYGKGGMGHISGNKDRITANTFKFFVPCLENKFAFNDVESFIDVMGVQGRSLVFFIIRYINAEQVTGVIARNVEVRRHAQYIIGLWPSAFTRFKNKCFFHNFSLYNVILLIAS